MSRRDSFREAFYGPLFLKAFEEPNLSVRPLKPVFRFCYEGMGQHPYSITLLEGKIIVKKGDQYNYMIGNDSALTEKELRLLNFFKWSFPIQKHKYGPAKQRRIDSLVNLYPQLLDAKYYRQLMNKYITPNKDFTYTTKTLFISGTDYKKIVNAINASGFWKMPTVLNCSNPSMDGFGYGLEANNGRKFQVVNAEDCLDESTDFTKACQLLLRYAKVNKEIYVDKNR
jgi:hypothetical protein